LESAVDFYPEARVDIDEIAEFIAHDGSIPPLLKPAVVTLTIQVESY
jgi:hypothetical protein